jgi:TonB family protein
MLFFLDMRETMERFGARIAELHAFFDANYVPHNSPDDFFAFAQVLENDNQLRNDLSALIKSIVKRESSGLLLTDMMSILAASIGGPSLEETQADFTRPTNTIMEFLLGTGCWRQFGAPSPPASATPKPSIRAQEPGPAHLSSHHPPVVSKANDVLDTKDSLLDASSELRRKLTRLEISTLKVKLHLEAIEQRIRKIDATSDSHSANPVPPLKPRVVEPTTRTQPIAAPPTVSPLSAVASPVIAAQPIVETAPAFEAPLPTRGRAVFSHDPEDDGFPSPTFSFAGEGRKNTIPIAIFLVLLAIAAVLFWFSHAGKGQTLLSRVGNVRAFFHHSSAATQPAPPAPSTSTSMPTAPAIPTPEKATAQTAPEDSAGDDNAAPDTMPDTRFSLSNSKIRYVQSSVMEGYLLSAPGPEYPETARAAHIEGTVTLEAIISKSGSVQTLRAVKGPQPLRAAAIDAVRYWRYKPYSVDGRPVEVATTVYVRFGPQQPKL